jgi:hypothetical protein
MASTNDVIFPESMADILANPVYICFGSMLATSTASATCLVIDCNAVTTDQQIGSDLLKETHPSVDAKSAPCAKHTASRTKLA